jgi:GntR family transcriptional regulator, transcriptional repressor for pyruvate dehydrogenase complex
MANRQVHQKVVNSLMRDIFANKLHPGEKLPPERELSKAMDVDRTSLRVALKQLESMNLLDIRPGDGIYVKDFLKHAGIDFLRLLFSLDDEASTELISDKYVIDEVWEWWASIFPEMVKLAARRLSARDLKALGELFDREMEAVDNRDLVVELEIAEQDLIAEVANNMIMILISNSSRPMRKKIAEIFVNSIEKEALIEFVNIKKNLIRDYLLDPAANFDLAAEHYRGIINSHRQMVRRALS